MKCKKCGQEISNDLKNFAIIVEKKYPKTA